MKQPVFRKFKSTGVTAAFLTLALGGAVYLNWSYARALPAEAQIVGAAAKGTAAVTDPLLPAAADADAGNTAKNYGEAQLVSVVKDAGTSFFESARLSRDKARDEALETLKKALKNAKLTEEEKTALTEKLSASALPERGLFPVFSICTIFCLLCSPFIVFIPPPDEDS